jgi:hypothetical protein
MAHIHETISGHRVEYPDPNPKIERSLRRVRELAEDARATEDDLIKLVYGRENPLLDQDALPGRGAVTRELLDDPVYQVLTDLLARKRYQQEGTDVEKLARKFTLTVAEAAERKGVSADAIRKGVRERRLPSWVKDGQYYLEPKSLDAIELGRRGPVAANVEPLEYRQGYDPATKTTFRVRAVGEPAPEGDGPLKGTIKRWRRALVLSGGGGKLRAFELEPSGEANELEFGGFWVRGKFRVARKVNSARAAREAWDAA